MRCCPCSELLTTVLDMLSVLIHGTLVSENSDKGETENRKAYSNLIKKLKVSRSKSAQQKLPRFRSIAVCQLCLTSRDFSRKTRRVNRL